MKASIGVFLVCASVLFATQVQATTLPDACGSDGTKFSIHTQKNQTTPAGPDAGLARIVFIEQIEKQGPDLCFNCNVETRFGVDGKWVGANKGNSYFIYDLPPGEYHLCVNWQSHIHSLAKNVGVGSINVEAGDVYYFEARVVMKQRDAGFGRTEDVNRLALTQLSEDEGKYAVKISALSRSKPKK
jgi:hypothetical protein